MSIFKKDNTPGFCDGVEHVNLSDHLEVDDVAVFSRADGSQYVVITSRPRTPIPDEVLGELDF